ncbi:uncharacterized protein LOC127860712 isoform X2 [Dreissena polymorpha]|uniref:uncharacterized protein LOC127860712 isoform X2 n=1 Tax=Dreissena polymorpha TaxID=45954 RepID=UPI002263B2AA|nr:uncharacterized protein LOC127860712 isoform X2 [Dreissena polymorpha]
MLCAGLYIYQVNKLVRANSFCLDCGQYLCEKCKMDHRGFRIYRRHTFIGGKSIPGMVFNHDEVCGREILQSRSTSRARSRQSSRATTRARSFSGRRSPKRLIAKPTNKPKKPITIDEIYEVPRTLIHSTVGRQPLKDSQPKKAADKKKDDATASKKSKHVRYEEDQVVGVASLVGKYVTASPDDALPCHIISSTFLKNGKLVAADLSNKNIKLYDENYELESIIDIENFPIAMCASSDNPSEMFASSGNMIYTFTTAKLFKMIQAFPTDIRRIEGLTTWQKGVAALFKNKKAPSDKKGHLEVHLFNLEGRVLYQIVVSSPFSVRLVTPVWYIASSNDGSEIVLSDTQNNRIISVDIINWQVGNVVKGRDKGGCPGSLTMDEDGDLLIAWYGEVHKVSSNGHDLGTPVNKVPKDAVIAFNMTTHRLVVYTGRSENKNSTFQVYQLD